MERTRERGGLEEENERDNEGDNQQSHTYLSLMTDIQGHDL